MLVVLSAVILCHFETCLTAMIQLVNLCKIVPFILQRYSGVVSNNDQQNIRWLKSFKWDLFILVYNVYVSDWIRFVESTQIDKYIYKETDILINYRCLQFP